MTEKQISKLVAMLVEHQRCFIGLSDEDAQWVIQKTPEAIALMVEAITKREHEPKSFLKLISGSQSLMLDAVDGSEILAEAKDIFSWIDSDFVSYGADEKGQATAETAVDMHEMTKDGTFAQLFGSLNADVDKLCLTQHQIRNFVLKHRSQLRADGYGTFFLFKSKGKFFVAYVYFLSDGTLYVNVYRLECGYVCDAEFRRRIVVPQVA